jgi:hypothetical protein
MMKKLFLILLISPFFYSLSAQEIGLRFGEMAGNNIAIDGTFDFKVGRLHTDISFGEGVGIDIIYDFMYNPIMESSNIYYYVGMGVISLIHSDFELGATGEAGIELRFRTIPFVLGIDYRPSIIVIGNTDFHWNGFGFNMRYVF